MSWPGERSADSARAVPTCLACDRPEGGQEILEFVFYDDIDPGALATGMVTIRQTALPRLWALCRERGYGVVADVHVHPGGYGQSQSDSEHPVMPRAGHIAMILAGFRARTIPRRVQSGCMNFSVTARGPNTAQEDAAFSELEG